MAIAEIEISPDQVWTALTDPKQIEKYMFGSQVEADWKPGCRIVWRASTKGSGTRIMERSSRSSPGTASS
jgi:uncharacterized protein YndB with AHSA1/START domain